MRKLITIERTSPFSGKTNEMTMKVDVNDIYRWQDGELIQVALGYLTPHEREFIKTGITQEEWNSTFGEEEI